MGAATAMIDFVCAAGTTTDDADVVSLDAHVVEVAQPRNTR
jgi:hypothetical protein